MTNKWISTDEIRAKQSRVSEKDIPECSFCRTKPNHIGKIVAGPDLYICRTCVKDACNALMDTGFPIEQ